ncbi:mechanosensitive ion channel family protein [Pseudodesulfovibrio sediminis]|uniref:Mechanosensitive ion channel protein MscS n=1 Tax=Pseudodesulfovibrio sediminis TaxID=2810563 RepID=A0ABN6ELJ3_9BACT|nr:mechanosensitive ion channel domain-containing protein [Pseudodesulfovibrio sediminis]BCS86911.1 mechanosensitive ion channel protein MscS [Pseudodesulfovibrio sediminis]
MMEWLNNTYVIKTLESVALMLVVYTLAKLASSIATKEGKRNSEAPFAIKYTAIFFFGFALIFIWLEGLGSILTALTIVAAALTIVSKELILNFLGSFVIFWRELFAIGDRVQVGDSTGDVIGKGLFYFTLLEVGKSDSAGQSTGRLIKVPNAQVFTLPVINATRGAGYVWNEVQIAIQRTDNWENGRELLLQAVERYYEADAIDLDRIKKVFERKKVFFKFLTPRVYVSVSTGGICLTLRYLCRSRMTRESQDAITTDFLNSMQDLDIKLAEEQP